MSYAENLKVILKNEGGFVDDPLDSGGRTNYGITQNTYNDYCKSKKIALPRDVKSILSTEVEAIYKENYYDAMRCDDIDIICSKLALSVFDCGVNCGTGTAIKMLQKMLNVTVDGVIGKDTLGKLTEAQKTVGCNSLVQLYAYQRMIYYTKLILRKPSQTKFIASWLSRTMTITEANT